MTREGERPTVAFVNVLKPSHLFPDVQTVFFRHQLTIQIRRFCDQLSPRGQVFRIFSSVFQLGDMSLPTPGQDLKWGTLLLAIDPLEFRIIEILSHRVHHSNCHHAINPHEEDP